MIKRKCGTCRYFDDRGVAGSGWCQHPARRELRDMVLVRKSELACRNGWDQDMWEAIAQAGDLSAPADSSVHSTPLIGSNGHHEASPMVPPEQRGDASPYTDRLITTSTVRPRSIGAPATAMHITPDAPPAFSTTERGAEGHEPHSVVRDARRRIQEQRETFKPRAIEGLTPPDVSSPQSSTRQREGSPAGDSHHPSAAAANPKPRRQPVTMPDDEAVSSPMVAGSVPGASAMRSMSASIPTGTRDTGTDGEPPIAPAPVLRRSGAASRPVSPRAQQTEQLPVKEVMAFSAAAFPPVSAPNVEPPVRHRTDRVSQRRPSVPGAAATPVSRRGHGNPPSAHGGATEAVTTAVRPARREQAPLARPAVPELPAAEPVDPIDRDPRLRGVPRCCATCRDFRPSGDGEQGWCASSYALTERRMVKSAELACHSSFGVWWLPHDDLWLERADVTHHGRPTPLADGLKQAPPSRPLTRARTT